MKIFINNEELNFTLENEKNLKEVINAINDWLFTNGKVVDQIIINGKIYQDEIENLKKFPIKKVNELRLTVIDINILVQSSLMETKRYLLEMFNLIKSRFEFTESTIVKIINGAKWAINILKRSNSLYNYESKFNTGEFIFPKAFNQLNETINFIETLFKEKKINEVKEEIKNQLAPQIDNWTKWIDYLIENSTSIVNKLSITRDKITKQLYKIIGKIPDIIKLVEVTTFDLHTGNEKSAMKNIEIISGTLESIIGLLQIIKTTFSIEFNKVKVNDTDAETFLKELSDILQEMLDAMESGDTVLLSDLLEYELAPRLEKYIDILKAITTEVNIDIN